MHLILDPRSDPSGNRRKSRNPNIWVIIAVVGSIILAAIIGIILIILCIRYKKKPSGPVPPPRTRLFYLYSHFIFNRKTKFLFRSDLEAATTLIHK